MAIGVAKRAPSRTRKETIMDIYRTGGIAAAVLGIILIALAWMYAPALLGPLDPTIGGYGRNTVLLVGAGIIALAGGFASYILAKPAA
jgi:hypothetical protein